MRNTDFHSNLFPNAVYLHSTAVLVAMYSLLSANLTIYTTQHIWLSTEGP